MNVVNIINGFQEILQVFFLCKSRQLRYVIEASVNYSLNTCLLKDLKEFLRALLSKADREQADLTRHDYHFLFRHKQFDRPKVCTPFSNIPRALANQFEEKEKAVPLGSPGSS